jgi:hypothetical protein
MRTAVSGPENGAWPPRCRKCAVRGPNQYLSNQLAEVGSRAEALPTTEEAVQRYRDLAATNPCYLLDLETRTETKARTPVCADRRFL